MHRQMPPFLLSPSHVQVISLLPVHPVLFFHLLLSSISLCKPPPHAYDIPFSHLHLSAPICNPPTSNDKSSCLPPHLSKAPSDTYHLAAFFSLLSPAYSH